MSDLFAQNENKNSAITESDKLIEKFNKLPVAEKGKEFEALCRETEKNPLKAKDTFDFAAKFLKNEADKKEKIESQFLVNITNQLKIMSILLANPKGIKVNEQATELIPVLLSSLKDQRHSVTDLSAITDLLKHLGTTKENHQDVTEGLEALKTLAKEGKIKEDTRKNEDLIKTIEQTLTELNTIRARDEKIEKNNKKEAPKLPPKSVLV